MSAMRDLSPRRAAELRAALLAVGAMAALYLATAVARDGDRRFSDLRLA